MTWIEMGWPGSLQDNQVWSSSEIHLCKDKYFNHKDYLLGNSAFSASSVMVHAFKKGHNANLSKEKK
jgi:DDE superfamily endonuclease